MRDMELEIAFHYMQLREFKDRYASENKFYKDLSKVEKIKIKELQDQLIKGTYVHKEPVSVTINYEKKVKELYNMDGIKIGVRYLTPIDLQKYFGLDQ